MKFAALSLLCLVSLSQAASSGYFAPEHRLAGIGVAAMALPMTHWPRAHG